MGLESTHPRARHFLAVGMGTNNWGCRARGCWDSAWAPKGSQRESSLRAFLSLSRMAHPPSTPSSAETPSGRLVRAWHCPLQGPVAGKHHLKCHNFSPVFLWLAYLCKFRTTIPSIFIANDRGLPFYLGGLAGLTGNCPTHLSTLVISMTHKLAFLSGNHLCKVNWTDIIFQTQSVQFHTQHIGTKGDICHITVSPVNALFIYTVYLFIFMSVTRHYKHILEHFSYIKREYTSILYIFSLRSSKYSAEKMKIAVQEGFRVKTCNYQSYTCLLPCNLNIKYQRKT